MAQYKMFCSFCHALGKSQEVFTSHWVKDQIGGVVVCPALLANECGYCHDVGHTPKFCPKLKARDARRLTDEETAEGEAFFDNTHDALEAVEAIAASEAPTLLRQGAFGEPGATSAPLPVATSRRHPMFSPPPLARPPLRRQQTTAAKEAFASGEMTLEEARAFDLRRLPGSPPPIWTHAQIYELRQNLGVPGNPPPIKVPKN